MSLTPNKRALLELLLEKRARGAERGAIPRRTDPGPPPLSFSQERLWFQAELDPTSTAYNIRRVLAIEGPLDVPRLAAALDGIVRRHEILRTTFPAAGGAPRQVVSREPLSALEHLAFDDLPPEERHPRASAWIAAELRRPFDLAGGPLLRTTLLRLGPTDHRLVIAMHHIISDGWSLGVFFRELSRRYADPERAFAPLPLQFADFSAWQRGAHGEESFAADLSYWTEVLTGLPPLELPLDHPRPSSPSHRGRREPIVVDLELTRAIEALARQAAATPFMVVLAAFEVLLARHSGQEDFAIGVPVAGRGPRELDELIGCFVNTLVMRSQLAGDPTFLTLLERVKAGALGAFAHQTLPFERLVEALSPVRDLSRAPLFQAMFVLRDTPHEGEVELPGLSVSLVDLDPGTSQLDLSLYLTRGPGGLTGHFEHSTELFEAGTAERLATGLVVLLRGLTAAPYTPISRLPLLDPRERTRLITEWNRTTTVVSAPPADVWISTWARETPERIAATDEAGAITYGDLDRRANRLAHHLSSRGVAPGALIGLAVERSVELLVGLLGIMKAGAAYLPIDPAFPERRIAAVLEDAGVSLVVTEQHLAHLFVTPLVRLDADESRIALSPDDAPPIERRAGALAYVIYTSGSTGRPKGVAVGHAALTNLLAAMERTFPLSTEDVWLAVTTISFDIAALELLLPLCRGATVVLASRETALDPERLLGLLSTSGATIMQATPATWGMLVEAADPRGALAGLRALSGGEALPPELARRLLPRVRELHNLYGPTETTIWSAHHRVTGGPELEGPRVPIGAPIANTSLHVLDPHGEPTPLGVTGELYIGGLGLANGYLRRPDLTSERFVPDHLRDVLTLSGGPSSGRLYRTGDLARRRPSGLLEVLGRTDHQIKLRGFRIELGEIEAVIAGHPGVALPVAWVCGTGASARLALYYTTRPGRTVDVAELRAIAKERLPEYMVPSAWVALEAFPLTPNGKVDRRALPEPSGPPAGERAGRTLWPPPDRGEHASGEPPPDAVELHLARLFAEVLGAPRIDAGDDFFALGGHSLLGARLIARAREAFHVDLPLRALFEAPTVESLARYIGASRSETAPLPAIDRAPRDQPLPLSHAQERIWFLDRFEGETGAYNISVALAVEGPLDPGALDAALCAVEARHEVLRTTFSLEGARPVQRIEPPRTTILEHEDARGAGAEPGGLERLITLEAERPFDLERQHPLRARLLSLGDERAVLVSTLHHVAADGWSIGLFLDDLSAAYRAASAGRAATLPDLPIQYADFSVWQRTHLTAEHLAPGLAFWETQLRGAPRLLELPTDRPRPAIQRFDGRTERFTIDRELTAALNRLRDRAGATTYMVLLAAWTALLSRITGQEDIAIGSPIATRGSTETERLIGCFINTLVLRTRLAGDPTFLELLSEVKRAALDAYGHRDVPFEHLIERLQPERDLSHTPLFQVMFILQNAPRSDVDLPGCKVLRLDREGTTAKLDLTLWMEEAAGGLSGGLEYNVDLFDRATAVRLVGLFRALLGAIARDPGEKVACLELLPLEERHAVTTRWNQTAADYPRSLAVDALVRAQARATPDAVAVDDGTERLTYRELTHRAAGLARHLGSRGAGAGARVGVALGRTVDLPVVLLGVLEAGAAYVPLDPAFPRARLQHMIEDSGLAALVATPGTVAALGLDLGPVPLVEPSATADDQPGAPPGPGPASAPELPVAERLAYTIYTSGSTGRPKGVDIRHGALVNFLSSMARSPGITSSDVVLAVTTISFDIAGLELFLPLVSGATVVLADRETASDGQRLRALIERVRPTMMQATPATWRMLTLSGWTGSAELTILTGGEALPVPLARDLLQRGRAVYNLYGPTETTIWSAAERLTPESLVGHEVVPIGHPIANTKLFVLDRRMQLAPIGVPGEVWIAGDGLARGYHARPELTQERFVPSPLPEHPGLLYRTGDLGRRLPDGRIAFLGRLDHQIKLRGFRIELGEVEAVLRDHPSIREVVAVVREDTPGDPRLVAYHVKRQGASVGADELRTFARTKLPEYMIPSVFVALEGLPLTPNGKIDRARLPSPGESPPELREVRSARNSLELRLISIWEEVLSRRPIGVHDNFFELGGHSLLAITLLDRLGHAFGRELSLMTIFRAPTVAELAGVLADGGLTVTPWHALEIIRPSGEMPPLFFIGSTLYARTLARAMRPAFPVYGLNVFGLHPKDGSRFSLSVEQIAGRYVEDLRSVQPRGPYYLAGYCADAKIAYEIAQQLERSGERVAFLGFIDEIWRRNPSVVRHLANNLRDFGADYVRHKVKQRSRYYLHKATVTAALLWRRAREAAHLPIPLSLQHQETIKILYRALGSYQPRPYPGRITLFLATESRARYSLELSRLAAGGVDVIEIPGFHVTMFAEPQVDILARSMEASIEKARSRGARGGA